MLLDAEAERVTPSSRYFPAGGTPADLVLPRAVRLPPQATHAIEVDADAPHRFQGIRIEFKA